MDVRIGITYAPKELSLEMEGSSEEILDQVKQALDQADGFLWLTDRRGRRIIVPLDKLAYIEMEGEEGTHRVGFGS